MKRDGDEMMDLITLIPASKNRCKNLDRLKPGERGCEACGRLLKPGAAVLEIETTLGVMAFGPECAKKMRKLLEVHAIDCMLDEDCTCPAGDLTSAGGAS